MPTQVCRKQFDIGPVNPFRLLPFLLLPFPYLFPFLSLPLPPLQIYNRFIPVSLCYSAPPVKNWRTLLKQFGINYGIFQEISQMFVINCVSLVHLCLVTWVRSANTSARYYVNSTGCGRVPERIRCRLCVLARGVGSSLKLAEEKGGGSGAEAP